MSKEESLDKTQQMNLLEMRAQLTPAEIFDMNNT